MKKYNRCPMSPASKAAGSVSRFGEGAAGRCVCKPKSRQGCGHQRLAPINIPGRTSELLRNSGSLFKLRFKGLFPLSLAVCLLLSSCNGGESGETETSASETTVAETAASVLTTSAEEEITVPTTTMSKEEVKNIAQSLPVKTFTAPDGKDQKAEDAVSIVADKSNNAYKLTFNSGYMGYAQPVYSDTDSNPGLYDFKNGGFNPEAAVNSETRVEDQKYHSFKKGENLENGLKVKDAYSVVSMWVKDGEKGFDITDSTLMLEGEITLEGILYCKKKSPDAVESYDEVLFFPDPEYSDKIPLPYFGEEFPVISLKDSKNDFAFVTSAFPFKLGTVGNLKVDLTEDFLKADCVKAQATISGITVRSYKNMPACFGVLDEVTVK